MEITKIWHFPFHNIRIFLNSKSMRKLWKSFQFVTIAYIMRTQSGIIIRYFLCKTGYPGIEPSGKIVEPLSKQCEANMVLLCPHFRGIVKTQWRYCVACQYGDIVKLIKWKGRGIVEPLWRRRFCGATVEVSWSHCGGIAGNFMGIV